MARVLGALLLAFVFAGCARCAGATTGPGAGAGTGTVESGAPDGAVVAVAVASSAPVGTASASADASASTDATATPAFFFPLPKAPPRTDPEKVLFAASVCAAAFRPDGSVGCRAPPPFDAEDRRPDGKILLHKGDPLRFCELQKIYRGAFSRAGAKQAMLSFGQCKEPDESATWDSGFPGNAVLVEEIAGRWQVVGYEGGVNTDGCKPSRRADGRDVLLCESNFGAFGIGTMRYFFALDFTREPKHAGTIAWLFADAPLFGCHGLEGTDPLAPSGLANVRVTRVALAELNGDGIPDLVVEVERARAAPSAALETKVRALCKQSAGMGRSVEAALPAATKTKLELVSGAGTFAPTAASKRLLDAWESESPDVTQLKGAAPPALSP